MRKKFSAGHGRLFRLFRFLHSLETLGGIKKMRLNSFGSKFLAVAAVGLFLAACEKAPENAANTGGSGSSTMSTGPSTSGIASGSVQDFQVNVGDRVFFDFDKYDEIGRAHV